MKISVVTAVFNRVGTIGEALDSVISQTGIDLEHVVQDGGSNDGTLAYLPRVMVRMRVGGASNRSLAQIARKSREDLRAIRRHRIGGLGTLLGKNVSKVTQFTARA